MKSKLFITTVDPLHRDWNIILSLPISSQLLWTSNYNIMQLNICWTISMKIKSVVFVCLILLNALTQLITNNFKKYGKYDLNGTELWFTTYLNERAKVVTLHGKMYNTKFIDEGVPQGSILRPLLFSIFSNDFPSCLFHMPSVIFLLMILWYVLVINH